MCNFMGCEFSGTQGTISSGSSTAQPEAPVLNHVQHDFNSDGALIMRNSISCGLSEEDSQKQEIPHKGVTKNPITGACANYLVRYRVYMSIGCPHPDCVRADAESYAKAQQEWDRKKAVPETSQILSNGNTEVRDGFGIVKTVASNGAVIWERGRDH